MEKTDNDSEPLNPLTSLSGEASLARKNKGTEREEKREQWTRKLDFILSCVGYAVGLGNVWRFPYLCYINGGASFLIPYVVCLVFCGIPIFYLEVALGQYVGKGVVKSWAAICPLFGGLGYAMLLITFLISVYYNVIIAWTLYYLFVTFRKTLPWGECGNEWNSNYCKKDRVMDATVNCTAIGLPLNCTGKYISPEEEYFNGHVLKLSDGIDQPGEIRWELAICLLVAWICVYFCVWKGVKSVGKVVYFTALFPYLVLFILLVRGATLEGAGDGVLFYLKPDFSRLKDPQVWVQAAGQIFYSLSIGMGGLLTYSSFNKFNNNCEKDSVVVSLVNCMTSFFAGFTVFTMMGFMAHLLKTEVGNAVKGGPGLVFMAFPEGIKQLPVSQLWAFLFFFMLFNLGLDSQFVGVETCTTVISDYSPRMRKYKSVISLGFCIICYVIGLAHVTQGGLYVFEMFDIQSGGISLVLIALLESIAIGWVYGTENFCKNIQDMIGHRPNLYFRLCWKFFCPVIILVIFVWQCVDWSGLSLGDYKYPVWAELVGWGLCLSSILCVPGYAFYRLFSDSSRPFKERFLSLLKPDEEIMRKIEQENGLPTQAEFALI
ncbi:hypothetical protein ACROYT_G007097 [Oculina patagonica]